MLLRWSLLPGQVERAVVQANGKRVELFGEQTHLIASERSNSFRPLHGAFAPISAQSRCEASLFWTSAACRRRLATSEEALLAVPANLYPERAVPVPYRDGAEFPDGMRAAAFGLHANNLVHGLVAKNWRNRQIAGC